MGEKNRENVVRGTRARRPSAAQRQKRPFFLAGGWESSGARASLARKSRPCRPRPAISPMAVAHAQSHHITLAVQSTRPAAAAVAAMRPRRRRRRAEIANPRVRRRPAAVYSTQWPHRDLPGGKDTCGVKSRANDRTRIGCGPLTLMADVLELALLLCIIGAAVGAALLFPDGSGDADRDDAVHQPSATPSLLATLLRMPAVDGDGLGPSIRAGHVAAVRVAPAKGLSFLGGRGGRCLAHVLLLTLLAVPLLGQPLVLPRGFSIRDPGSRRRGVPCGARERRQGGLCDGPW